MSNRAALITGASTGIGRAIATVLAEERYALTIVARDQHRLADTASALRTIHPYVLPINADVADERSLVDLVTAHKQRWDRLDVLVNNAGILRESPIHVLPTQQFELLIAVNLRAPMLLARECHALLSEAGAEHGRALIVNTSSIAGRIGGDRIAAYSATKAGLDAFTRSLNWELAPLGIRSIALCPALVDTPMTQHTRDGVPTAHMITPADIAEAVRFALRLSPRCVIPQIVFQRLGVGDLP